MAEDEKGTSSWYKVPTWNGNPQEWRSFKREMGWWIASLDPEACRKFNVAARWTLRQVGVVRARCEEFDPDDLAGAAEVVSTDPQTGEKRVLKEADPFAGIKKLLKALEASMGRTELDRKGELRKQFYQEIRRNPGERISSFCTRYRTLTAEMKREGINLPSGELGWFLRDRLGLDAIRSQLLETALAGRDGYDDVGAEALRLFRDIHTSDPLNKKQFDRPPLLQRFLSQSQASSSSSTRQSAAPSSHSSGRTVRSAVSSWNSQRQNHQRRPFGGLPRQALVAEGQCDDDEEAADDDELIPDGEDAEVSGSLAEVLQAEAEALAVDIQELEEDGSLDPQLLEEIEAGVEQAAESLLTMREAKTKINEIKRDRGFGKSGGKGKPTGNQITAKKGKTVCWDCGETGHWAGDQQCLKPGQGLAKPKASAKKPPAKHVKVVESLNTEHVEAGPGEAHEILVCQQDLRKKSLEAALHHEVAAAIVPSLANDKMMVGALDSACNRTCSGNVWLQHYLAALKHAPKCLRDLHATVQEDELFRFGNGGTQRSQVRHRLPMVVGDYLVLTWVSVVEVPSLGLLLGRDFLDSIGAVISFSKRQMRADHLDGKIINLKQLTAGHFAPQLIPQEWPQPLQKRWRRLGKCGILELQLTAQEWLQRKLAAVSVSALSSKVSSHEHLITEQGVQAADVKFSGLPIFATAAQNISSSNSLANGQRSLDSAVVSATTTPSLPTPSPLDGPGKLSNMGRKVAKIRAASAMPRRMASAWAAFVAIAVAANSICPTSISTCERCPWMGKSGGRDDGQQITGKEAWCQSHEGQGAEQCKFATLRQSSESHGPGACFPGRSSSTRHLGRQNHKGHGSSNPSSSFGGFETRGQEEQSRRQTTRSCSPADRAAWWTSSAESRFGEAGLPGQRRSRPGRHSGEVASQGEAIGRRHCSEASTKVSSSKGKSLAKQCTCRPFRRSPHRRDPRAVRSLWQRWTWPKFIS